MDNDYKIEYEDTSDQNLYNDGEDKKPKLVLIIGGIFLIVIIVLIFFFACSNKNKKSENNYLTNISVSNGEINPQFERNEHNYSIAVTDEFTTISCSAEDSKAVTDGCNKRIYLTEECTIHSIKVTSESGTIREYKLNICKQSKEAPIITNVKVTPESYTKDSVVLEIEVKSENPLSEEAYSFDGGKTWQASNKVTISENATVEIKVRDKNNNESASLIKEIKNIDKTNPSVIIKGSVDSGKSTTSNVVLTADVTPPTTVSEYKYQWYKDNEPIKNATKSTYTATSSGNYKVKVTTGSGVSKTSDVFVVNKKTNTKPSTPTAPKVTITKVTGIDEKWTTNVTLKVSASGDLHAKAYSFDGGKTWQTSNSKKFTSNGTINIVVRDKKGNKDTYKAYITKIDNTKPTISISGNNTVGSKLTASVTPNKNASGYKYQWYYEGKSVSGATIATYTAGKEGTYKVIVTTGAGLSSEKTITVKQDIPGSVKLSSSVTSGTWTKNSVTLTATPVNKKVSKYTWYRGTSVVDTTTTNTYTVNKDENASYKVEAVFEDGTKSYSSPITVRIDTTTPDVPTMKYTLGSYTGTTPYTSGTWTNKSVYRQIKASDNGSGIERFEYKNASSNSSSCSGNKDGTEVLNNATSGIDNNKDYQIKRALSSTNYACFRTVDKAGNVSAWTSVQNIKVDKTAPSKPKINLSSTSETSNNVTFTITSGSDSESGVQKTEYTYNDTTNNWTTYTSGNITLLSTTGEKRVYARTYDKAGNVSEEVYAIGKCDKDAVNVTRSSNGTGSNECYIKFTITPKNTLQDVQSNTYEYFYWNIEKTSDTTNKQSNEWKNKCGTLPSSSEMKKVTNGKITIHQQYSKQYFCFAVRPYRPNDYTGLNRWTIQRKHASTSGSC